MGSGRRRQHRRASRSTAHDTRIDASTTTSAAGSRGRKKRATRSAPSERVLTRTVVQLASPISSSTSKTCSSAGDVDVDSEQLAELSADEHDGDSVDVAHEHRARAVVGQPAEPRDPGEQEAGRDEQGERGGELRGLAASGDGEREQGGAYERRDRPFRPDDELPRRAEERIEHRRQEQGVEPVDRREASDLRVRHRRRAARARRPSARRSGRPAPWSAGTRACAR